MSRSYRHSPIKSYGSNRWNKQKYNRRYRRKTKVITSKQYIYKDYTIVWSNGVLTFCDLVNVPDENYLYTEFGYEAAYEYPPPVKDQEWHIREKKCWFGFHSWNWHPVEPEHQLRYK